MRNTFNLAFYCRKSHMDKKGLAPIELAISLNRRRTFINLPQKYNPDSFVKQMASKKGNDLKEYIAFVEERIQSFQIKQASSGKAITIESIYEYVKSGFNTSYTLSELWADFYALFKKKGTTPRNERKYELVINSFFENVLPGSYQVSELNHAHIVAFEQHLKANSGLMTGALCGLETSSAS